MLKLILCLLCAFVIGAATLQMRQQHLELRHQAAVLQKQIENQQAKLWDQQMHIAVYTAPNAIDETVGHDLELVPAADLPEKAADWLHTDEEEKPAE